MKKILLQRYAIFWSRSKYKPLFFPVLLRQARHFRTKKHQGIKFCPFFSQEEGIFVRKSRAFSFTSFICSFFCHTRVYAAVLMTAVSRRLAPSASRACVRALQPKWRKLVTPSTPAADYQAVAAADGSTSGSTNAHTGTDT
jgi:hypothetical protein